MQTQNKIDEIIEKQEQRNKAIVDYENKLKFSCAKVFATQEGQFIARYLKDICGFTDFCNDVNPNINIFINARRDIYLKLRQYIPSNQLIKIEIKE